MADDEPAAGPNVKGELVAGEPSRAGGIAKGKAGAALAAADVGGGDEIDGSVVAGEPPNAGGIAKGKDGAALVAADVGGGDEIDGFMEEEAPPNRGFDGEPTGGPNGELGAGDELERVDLRLERVGCVVLWSSNRLDASLSALFLQANWVQMSASSVNI